MTWLWLVLEIALELFAAWTLAVHACLATGAPAVAAWPLFAAVFAGFQFLGRRRWARVRREEANDAGLLLSVVVLGAILSVPALLLLTPSGDDFNFFHRAIWQLSRLSEPFATGDTAFSAEGLAAISPLHTLTTWELGIAMTADAVDLDALAVYHNGTVVLTTTLLVCLFALWLRELGFGAASSLLGVGAVFAYFAIDDPAVRSYGIAWRMLWVGKMVQWLLLFPLSLLFAWRYLRDEATSARLLVHPFCCGVAAVGLSGTGVFLLPGIFAAASLAAFLSGPPSLARLFRCGWLNVASAYCFAVAALLVSGVLAQPTDMSAWTDSFPSNWLDSLFLVFAHVPGLLKVGFLALVVPGALLGKANGRFLTLYSLSLLVIFMNPVAGPVWMAAAQPGSYWRVALLLPVTLGVAIASAAAAELLLRRLAGDHGSAVKVRPARVLLVAVVGLVLIVGSRNTAPRSGAHMRHDYETKPAFGLRFAPAQLRFLNSVRSELEGRRLLAAPGIATTAALLVPTVRIDAARLKDTRHVFANAGRLQEGVKRVAAWKWAGSCSPNPPGARAALSLIGDGTDALILRACPSNRLVDAERERVLTSGVADWREVLRADGFVLYLRS